MCFQLVYDALVKLVNQSIPGLQLENLPFRFPEWKYVTLFGGLEMVLT